MPVLLSISSKVSNYGTGIRVLSFVCDLAGVFWKTYLLSLIILIGGTETRTQNNYFWSAVDLLGQMGAFTE